MSSGLHWEHFDRGADVGVRGFGWSRAAAFEQAALGLAAVVVEPSDVREVEWLDIRVAADDPQLLLADWLNAVLTEMSAQRMLFCRFHVALHGDTLTARVAGEPVSLERHRLRGDVRAASHAEALVTFEGERWIAQAVLGL